MRSVKEQTLAELADSIQYGYTASASDVFVGPHFLRITDIVPSQIDWSKVPYCKIDEKKEKRFLLAPGDIVIARTGATVGYAKLIRENPESVFASYLVRVRIDPKMADSGYVGRIVESKVYKKFILSHTNGAAQPNANAKILTSFRLPIPDRATQLKFVKILSSYDNLIENNRRRIQLLEESARLLYKEWFVQLRFPGHEHVKVVNGVPEGWEKKKIGELSPFKYGKSLKKDVRIPGPYPVFGSSGIVGSHDKALVKGPTIIIGRKGNVGSVYWSSNDCYPIDTVYFIDPDNSRIYLYYALLHTNFINTDIAVPGLNRDYAHSLEIMVPDQIFLSLFEEHAKNIHRQIDCLIEYNKILTQARDLLLPRFMNGEITI